MGCYPWVETSDGASLTPYHQACVRMMRADYCGDGKPFTVTGKRIQVIDTIGERQHSARRYGAFEAVWGVNGAICVSRARAPDRFSLEQILRACPALRPHTGAHCSEAVLTRHPSALLANWSRP